MALTPIKGSVATETLAICTCPECGFKFDATFGKEEGLECECPNCEVNRLSDEIAKLEQQLYGPKG